MTDRIEKSIELRAPVERVWQALTDHREFGQWFRVNIESPFVPGEVSRGHLAIPGYEHVKWESEIVAMNKPRYFAYRWHPYAVDPERDYSGEPTTLVEFTLEPTPGGTRLTVTETGFDALPADRGPEALRMNEGGWEAQIGNIEAHLARHADA